MVAVERLYSVSEIFRPEAMGKRCQFKVDEEVDEVAGIDAEISRGKGNVF